VKIQNRALAGVALQLRFSPQQVTGDAQGIFDVPEEDGAFLLGTSGWRVVDPDEQKAIAVQQAMHEQAKIDALKREAELIAEERARQEAAKKPPAEVVIADEQAALQAYEQGKQAAEAAQAEKNAIDPDLDRQDKNGLIRIADEYGVQIDRRWSEQRIRETLHKALYGEEN
jgi:hypothetical protein